MVLTPSREYQNMYSWQTGSTHPTGMLSCIFTGNAEILKVEWYGMSFILLLFFNWNNICPFANNQLPLHFIVTLLYINRILSKITFTTLL